MEDGSLKPLTLLRQYGLIVGLLSLGLIFFGVGLFQYFHMTPETPDVSFQTSTDPKPVLSPTETTEIVVDIEGAVLHPGVYHLQAHARLQEVVTASGGFTKTVDHEKVAKGLNLAEKVSDGSKIYVPFLGEETTASVGQQTTMQSGQTVLGTSSTSTGLININTASTESLDSLPGVGAVTAAKIIANRPYTETSDLVSKKALDQATYEKLKDKITAK